MITIDSLKKRLRLRPKTNSGNQKRPWCILWLTGCLLVNPVAAAATFEFLGVENVFSNPPRADRVMSRAIVVASNKKSLDHLPAKDLAALRGHFVFQTRVKVNGTVYYRLALGNFNTAADARIALKPLQATYADAWVYKRDRQEREQITQYLRARKIVGKATVSNKGAKPATDTKRAGKLLDLARQQFVDKKYARVIAITDKISVIGSLGQLRDATELAGAARERQGKFTQAVRLYQILLDTKPPEGMKQRILSRLEGIRTMSLTPKSRMAASPSNAARSRWDYRGALLQYYRDDLIDRPGESAEEVNRTLVTDLNLFAQKKTEKDKLVMQLDAGIVDDFLEKQIDNRVSRASIKYSKDDYEIIGGRQSRTVKGVYGRFDGVVYKDLSRTEFNLAYAYGYLVESSFDNIQTKRPFIGANLSLSPYPWLDADLYLMHQENYGLTDRQAVGSEIQIQSDTGFVYGIFDYDTFYHELNNLTLISNYKYSSRWAYNLTINQGKSPTLSTINALQGQGVATMGELRNLFTPSQIYQLAKDRTSDSRGIFTGANYRIDEDRQLHFNISRLTSDATVASGGVEAIPSSTDMQYAFDYSIHGYFYADDYSGVGLRLSDAATSKRISVRLRSRFKGYAGLIYNPRIRLDKRSGKTDNINQYILSPSIKVKYRSSRRFNLEGNFGIEYSDLNLPNSSKQIAYSLYLGYIYLF